MEPAAAIIEDALARLPGTGLFPCSETPGLTEGERRRAAVLFLDLTGFTHLSESLDHEELHRLLGSVMGVLARVVTAYGGLLDKFEGDRLMALFGAVDSSENDSSRAVGCALRMLDLLEELRTALDEVPLLSARIGIDFGQLTVAPDPSGHLTATGLTVNLASRLEQAAEPGTALVSQAVRKECGDLYQWRGLGPIRIRGVSSGVEVFRPLGPGRVRLERWQRAARLTGSPFVGRATAIRSVAGALASPLHDARILLRGEAGIGKSRLAHHCMEKAPGFTVARGHTLSHAQPSCWLWISLIRDYFDAGRRGDGSQEWYRSCLNGLALECARGAARTALEGMAGQLSSVLSLDAAGFRSGKANEFQALTNGIRSALEAVFSRGATLLLLEDLHWIDEVSLSILRIMLCQGMMYRPGAVIMTSRQPLPLMEDASASVRTIELDPLTDDDALAIASHLLSCPDAGALDHRLSGMVLEVAKGNPFVVEELILNLLESGGIREENGQWKLLLPCDRVQIPSSISALTQTRMDRLPGNERRTLQYASVLGERFSPEILEAVMADLSLDGTLLGNTLESLVARGFLVGNGGSGYCFRHALVRMAAYETLLKHNCRLLHRSAAAALERHHPTELDALAPVILAHWEGADDRGNAFKWARRAMLLARDGGRPEEALRLSRRLIELAGDADDETMWQGRMQALLVGLEMMERGGDHEQAIRAADAIRLEAVQRGSSFWEASALRAKARVLQEMGRNNEFGQVIGKALQAAQDSGDEVLAAKVRMTMANHRSSLGIEEGTMELYEAAAAALEKHGMSIEAASLMTNMAVHAFRQGNDQLSAHYARMALDTQKMHGNLQAVGYSLNSLAIACARREKYDRAEELFLEALDATRKTGDRVHECTVLGNLGLLARKRGDPGKAMEYTDASIELATLCRNNRTVATSLVNRTNLQRTAGDLEGAMASAVESLRISEKGNDVLNTAYSLGVLGLVHLEAGRTEDALKTARKLRLHVEQHSIRPEVLDDFRHLLERLSAMGLPAPLPSCWSSDKPLP